MLSKEPQKNHLGQKYHTCLTWVRLDTVVVQVRRQVLEFHMLPMQTVQVEGNKYIQIFEVFW